MKKNSIIILFLLVVFSCRHEENTYTQSFINNNTAYSITICPFYEGDIVKEDFIKISANQRYLLLDKTNRGKGSGFSYPDYIAIYDSVRIIFNEVDSITHYSYATSSILTNTKAISFSSNRSIYNENNYVRRILSEDKYSITNEYTFIFKEQDYLDAQNL